MVESELYFLSLSDKVNFMKNLKELMLSKDPVGDLWNMVNNGTLADFEQNIANLKMDIPTGYHHKDNLVHSIHVLENAINMEFNGPDLILRTAALLHDIGKPATRKLGAKKSVSFDGHEIIGARLAKKILASHGFSKQEKDDITLLIRLHMRSHGFDKGDWTDSGVRRLIHDVDNEPNLKKLIILFKADSTTKNKAKKNAVLNSIKHLESEIERIKLEDKRKALRPALNGNDVMRIFNLSPGRDLGKIMKFLNTDEGIYLTETEEIGRAHV